MSFPEKSRADCLIVGAGIAAQLLARELARRGQRVCLAHAAERPGASRVAAWMINPVTGIRFVPSWRVEEFLPAAVRLYAELERETGLKIWHPLPIMRLFQGADEWPRWEKKRHLPAVSRYVAAEFSHLPEMPNVPNVPNVRHAGGGMVFHSGGWADLGPWLQHHLEHPTAGVEVVAGKVERAELQRTPLTWRERRFDRVIFCNGYDRSALPWKPAKGELLTVRIPGLNLQQILLRGIFVIPLGGDLYRVGATYEWEDLTNACTDAGRDFLTKQLTALIDLPFEMVDQQTAIRPILRDARPVIGMEIADPRFGLCNGFGSKAALMAPGIIPHFADHLLDGVPLDAEVDLGRLPKD